MIPKIVHYIWVGPKRFPDDARAMVEDWKRLLPDYEFRFWTEENIDFSSSFVCQAYGVGAYNRVANYVRMSVLDRFGGVYMDHDVELLKSFDPMLGDGAFAGFQTLDVTAVDVVNTAILGAEPGHPIVRAMLAAMDARNGADEVGSGTGPGLLSRVLRERGDLVSSDLPLTIQGMKLYPPRYFYPYEWFETFDEACVTPETVTIHRWAHSWKRNPRLLAALRLRAWRRIALINPVMIAAYVRAGNMRRRIAPETGPA